MDFENFLKNHWGKILVAAVVGWFVLAYNGANQAEQASKGAWANVGSNYQRQADLIPGLVEVTKGYANHESGVFKSVTEARSRTGQVNVDVSKLAGNPEAQKQLSQATGEMTSLLTRLIAVSEKYPDLKADRQFSKLSDELAGSANRIAIARKDAISVDRIYNSRLGNLPWGPVLSVKFSARPYYEAPASAYQVPTVKF